MNIKIRKEEKMRQRFIPNEAFRKFKIRDTKKQFMILKKYFDTFRSFELSFQTQDKALPIDSESYFVGADFALLSDCYEEAVKMVFETISENRPFKNKLSNQMSAKHLRPGSMCNGILDIICEDQNDNHVIVYPAQLGTILYGLTPGKARRLSEQRNRFGLSTFLVSLIILTHPDILISKDEMGICCIGDDYSPNGDYNFDSSPVFYLDNDGKTLVFDYINRGTNWNNTIGCATGLFIPTN
ncbi:hypothetical protein GW764_03825 [Candidatus Parcubacteria bacterium]|nr:hypothetical protein [Candidatus Parcubacteria bacterium]